MTAELLAAALDWHHHGHTIVPARPDGSKAPATFWKQYQTTRPTETQLHTWFHNGTYDGLGAITGTISGNLEMLEFEGRATSLIPPFMQTMIDNGFQDLWDKVATGYVERTPTGGLHFYYRVNGQTARNTKLASRPSTPDELTAEPHAKVKVLIETRGEGGFTIVAPSAGRTHPTGKAWDVLLGTPATIPTLTTGERDTLYAIAASFDQLPTPPVEERVTVTPPTGDEVRPGDAFTATTPWADILTPHGWTAGRTDTQGTTYWTRPGKNTRDGISATTRKDGGLYVFSTSTEFDTEKPYSKFGAYAVLEHGGDHRAAARDLASRGYGTPRQDGPTELTPPPTPAQALQDALDHGEQATPDSEGDPSPSWRPIDLTPYLDGTWAPTQPTMLARDDGINLIYPGLVHDLHGESESGKSLVAQHLATTLITAGSPVLYVDFESDAGQVVHRFLAMGATPHQIATHLTYVRPESSPLTLIEAPEWAAILGRQFTLAILDGVTDALGMFGGATKENDDIAAWHRAVPRMLARRTGAAVVLVDHVVKNTDTRGRFAIGGQAKMAAIDGASYSVEITEPIGKGVAGSITLRIGKDRPGEIRANCGSWRSVDRTQEAAKVTIDSTDPTHIRVSVISPTSTVADRDEAKDFKPTGIMEKLSRLLEAVGEPMSKRTILRTYKDDGGKARDQTIYDALNKLIDGGWVVESDPFRGHPTFAHERSYRQVEDPESDAYEVQIGEFTAPLNAVLPSASRVLPGSTNGECFPASPPVGGSGSTRTPHGSDTASASHPKSDYKYDYRLGEYVHPETGELWDGD